MDQVNNKCSKICIFVSLKTIERTFLSFKFRLRGHILNFDLKYEMESN